MNVQTTNEVRNTNIVFFQGDCFPIISTTQFKAGRLKDFAHNWKKLTSDAFILDTVQHCHIEFKQGSSCDQHNVRVQKFNSTEQNIIDAEILRLCEKGVLEETTHCKGEFISPIFTRRKKDGTYRLILNLKEFNENVEYHHFKMESIQSVINMVTPNCFMASIDIKDAYYSVPIAPEHRKYLRFKWKGKLLQYTCFPNGLACCPRLFTKLLKPVYASLRQTGDEIVPYIDDSYLQGDTEQECWQSVKKTALLLQDLGFIIHPDKSVFLPKRVLTFLGFVINSIDMTVQLTPAKANHLREACTKLLNAQHPTIRDVAQVIGLMVSSAPAVELCMLFYRTLENEKIDALKENHGDFDARMELSASAKSDLQWWVDNVQQSEKKISPPNPDIVMTTDASKQGWGAVRDHHTTGGRWSPAEAEKHINELELKAVFFALCSLCDNVRNKHIRILFDNTTTVCYINNMGGSKSRACNIIAKKIWQFALERNNFLSSAHLPGTQNMLADRESRVFNDRTEWMLHQDIFQKLSLLWGPFEIDLFASRLNKQVCTYVSWKPDPGATAVDAFSILWDRKPFYAFPPFSLIHRCLQKIIADKAEGVIIVPMWPTQTYYPRLMSMLIQMPRLLPRKENLLRLPHSQKSHPLWKKMQLMACLVSGIVSKQKEFQKKQEESCCSHGENLPGTSMASISKSGNNFVVKGTLIHMTYL